VIILGIDPGLALMGYGIIEYVRNESRMINFGCITTQAHSPTPQRLRTIHSGISQLLEIYKPDAIAFEELFFVKNITTGIAVAEARGAALAACAAYTEELYEYTPMQIKQAITGYGKADKVQMQNMVKLLLRMEKVAKPDDAADALAVAITHANCSHAADMYRIK